MSEAMRDDLVITLTMEWRVDYAPGGEVRDDRKHWGLYVGAQRLAVVVPNNPWSISVFGDDLSCRCATLSEAKELAIKLLLTIMACEGVRVREPVGADLPRDISSPDA